MINESTKISAVKLHLNITWSDEETDKKIKGIIEDAENYLNHKLGAEIDYFQPGAERRLFLSYCSYLYNEVQNEFEKDYQNNLNELRRKYAVIARKNGKENSNIQ